ncbi:MAG: hypothetical protein KA807_11280 [Prolixibacteraceae bacterium]|nr:hypothetical protein [Prolixibacteraceae bacterium]
MNTKNAKPDDNKVTEDELLESMANSDNYSHLRILLSHKPFKAILPHLFLMVTPSSFGVVKLLDIDYEENNIIVHLQDFVTEVISKVYLDIHEKRYKFLLIEWQDVLDMAISYQKNKEIKNEMLELDENEYN